MEPGEHRVLVCLPRDERKAAAALAAATRAAQDLNAPLTVIHLYPSNWRGPLVPHPSAWHLKTDAPTEAVARFVERHRITRVVY